MKVKFWLLDVTYEVKEHMSEICLWGVDDSGNRVLIIDRSFLAYFYALVQNNTSAAKLLEEIDAEKAQYQFVTDLEIVERRFFGNSVKAVKVYCKDANLLSKCAEDFRRFEGVKDCLEDDIRYSMRYLIDNNVVPCGWHEIEVTEEENTSDIQIDKVYRAKSPPEFLENAGVPQLRILGFTMVCYSKEGSPKPDRNPVVIISIVTSDGEEKQLVAKDEDDRPVLETFINYLRSFDPDVIVNFNANRQDWPYLKERCGNLGIKMSIDRGGTEIHRSVYGHISITGRINLDLSDFADEFPEVKFKTLENLADHLGVMKIGSRVLVEDTDLADYWEDKKKRDTLKRFSMDNTRCVMGISNAVLDFAMQLSNLVSLPLDHVGTAAVGFRIEWFLIKHAQKIGEIVPKRVQKPYRPYTGAIVLKPKPGLHENVAVYDFGAMYPNIMIKYNLSPDTYISPRETIPSCGFYEAPQVKHKFRKEPSGFYKEVLSYLISARDQIRSEMKAFSSESPQYRVLDARQKAVKVITNACYGYAGWTGARWYVKPVAEAAAAWGRHVILTAMRFAQEAELKVVYSDTDSLFITHEPKKIEKLLRIINEKLSLEIKPDKIYVRLFFTEAKKRYAGLLRDGRLDIVGLEVVRGDWATIAKKTQEKVLEIILKEQSPEKAAKFVQQFINDLRERRVPYRDLIIWKTLTKPIDEYAIRTSHVEAAKILKDKGWSLAVGDKIGYVVTFGSGRLYERVKPHMFASYDQVDLEYYVSKQIVPAAIRVLEYFGITDEQLSTSKMEKRKTRKLTEFFGG